MRSIKINVMVGRICVFLLSLKGKCIGISLLFLGASLVESFWRQTHKVSCDVFQTEWWWITEESCLMFTHGKICLALTALQKYKQSLTWNLSLQFSRRNCNKPRIQVLSSVRYCVLCGVINASSIHANFPDYLARNRLLFLPLLHVLVLLLVWVN